MTTMRMTANHMLFVVALIASTGCTFNFDVTSQRTALENQVMGSYKELEDDLILASSVRGGAQARAALPPGRQKAVAARQEQEFNRDDIDELKTKAVLGEGASGELVLLPSAKQDKAALSGGDGKLARLMVDQENRDRAEIWRQTIAGNQNLKESDLGEVRRTYAKLMRAQAEPGHWLQTEEGTWQQKPGPESLK